MQLLVLLTKPPQAVKAVVHLNMCFVSFFRIVLLWSRSSSG